MARARAAVALLLRAAAAYDNGGYAARPPLGWQSWCAVGSCGTDHCFDRQIRETADAMVANGMLARGYEWIVLDDCWHPTRDDASGDLVPSPTFFPDGLQPVIDYVRAGVPRPEALVPLPEERGRAVAALGQRLERRAAGPGQEEARRERRAAVAAREVAEAAAAGPRLLREVRVDLERQIQKEEARLVEVGVVGHEVPGRTDGLLGRLGRGDALAELVHRPIDGDGPRAGAAVDVAVGRRHGRHALGRAPLHRADARVGLPEFRWLHSGCPSWRCPQKVCDAANLQPIVLFSGRSSPSAPGGHSTMALARQETTALAGGGRRILVICPMANGIDNELEFHVPAKSLAKKTPWLALSAIRALKKKAGANGPTVRETGASVWLQRPSGERIEPTACVGDITDGATVRVRWRNPDGLEGDGSSSAPSKWDFTFRDAEAPKRLDGQLSNCYYPEPTKLYPDRKPLVHSPYSKSLYYYLEREANEQEYHGELSEIAAFLYAKAKHQGYMMRVCEVDAQKREKALFDARADHKKTKKRLDKQNAELEAYRAKLADQKAEIELYKKSLLGARAEASAKNARALDRAAAATAGPLDLAAAATAAE